MTGTAADVFDPLAEGEHTQLVSPFDARLLRKTPLAAIRTLRLLQNTPLPAMFVVCCDTPRSWTRDAHRLLRNTPQLNTQCSSSASKHPAPCDASRLLRNTAQLDTRCKRRPLLPSVKGVAYTNAEKRTFVDECEFVAFSSAPPATTVLLLANLTPRPKKAAQQK